MTFAQEEWAAFCIANLHFDDYRSRWSCRKSMTLPTIFNQLLANLSSGSVNQKPRKNKTNNSQDVYNGPAVVVKKEDQRAIDTTLGIERNTTGKLNLYSCETNLHWSDDIFSARGCTPAGDLDWAHHRNLAVARPQATWFRNQRGQLNRLYWWAHHVAGNDHFGKATRNRNRPRSDHGFEFRRLTLKLCIENSIVSTDSGHEYMWCPASNRIVLTGSNWSMIKTFVPIMNVGDRTGFVARPKKQSSAVTGTFSHDETTPPQLTRSDQLTTVVRLT